jgi:hypothetical protein
VVKVQLNDPAMGVHDPDNGQEHARIVPILADHGIDSYVPNGAVIEVPDDVAGAGPYWRERRPEDASNMESRTDEKSGKVTVHDLGHGLLAQVGIWSRPAPEKKGD